MEKVKDLISKFTLIFLPFHIGKTQEFDEETVCMICLTQFNTTNHIPLALVCGHSVCTTSKNQIYEIHNEIRCPICRKLEVRFDNIPINYQLKNLLNKKIKKE